MCKSLEVRDDKSEGNFEPWLCLPLSRHAVAFPEGYLIPGICPLSSGLTEEWTQATEKAPNIRFTVDTNTREKPAQKCETS